MSEASEKRLRAILYVYYSRPEIQKAIFEFSKHRETVPRYFEGFGKRPDSLQYPSDVFELVKKGATSMHCSEELWKNPLELSTNMNEKQLSSLRTGWDLLIDIDCKWIDGSKKAAEAVISVLRKNKVKNIGLKFSGGKGFHIIVPWKAFPKQIAGEETKNLFPELPRKIIEFLRSESERELRERVDEDFLSLFSKTEIKKGIKCNSCNEIADMFFSVDLRCNKCSRRETQKKRNAKEIKEMKCPECLGFLIPDKPRKIYECKKCSLNSLQSSGNFSKEAEIDLFELMGLDLILVSPRHLFRAPYSLHEKTALASTVIPIEKLREFDMKDANPMKIQTLDFVPDSAEGEATELTLRALDWSKTQKPEEKKTYSSEKFQPVKLENLSDLFLPPSIRKILLGLNDGRKRALFILLNLFRSIGMEKEELEKRIRDWNSKNKPPLKEGYIKSQLIWSYRNKVVPPPNFDKEYYRAVGVVPEEEELRMKNPVNYILKKSKSATGKRKKN